MIADMQTEIEAARGLLYYAAWLKDAHPTKVGASSSKAKLYASEMVNRVVDKAVQVHGSAGYSRATCWERPRSRRWRRVSLFLFSANSAFSVTSALNSFYVSRYGRR